ncbi:MAG: HAMP domain-containing histidine kinase [Clostridiales bacterium]|nr:HAMP domain-containing histidine kinase [Clostridiales bacterium]
MIRKLRIRLIIVTMAAVLLVLLILMGGINLSNYRQIVNDGDATLTRLLRNGGTFGERTLPPRDHDEEHPEFGAIMITKDDGNGQTTSSGFFWESGKKRMDSPEFPFETRYFSVLLTRDGEILRTDTGRISAVSEEEAEEYALSVLGKKNRSGFIGDYRYLSGQVENPDAYLIVFCDCGASLTTFRNFLTTSIVVSLLCLGLVFILVYYASGRVIRPVAESYEKQKRFITDAGHEIKTPLAIISADADVLEMELDQENEWVSDIKAQTKRLAELTSDLIFLSKMEESHTPLEMQELDLSFLTGSSVSSFRAVANASSQELLPQVDPDIHITGDKKSIESLLSIVMDNAVKYCPEGGRIDVKLYKDKRYAHLEVTNDTTDLISEESTKHLFDRFYRTDTSRNSETGGFGIGLSMAAAIVEKHKGKIVAESGKEREKTLTLSILLRLSQEDPSGYKKEGSAS